MRGRTSASGMEVSSTILAILRKVWTSCVSALPCLTWCLFSFCSVRRKMPCTIVERDQEPIQEFLLEILEVAHQQCRPFLWRKPKQGVAVIFLPQMGQHAHPIAVEPREIDSAHAGLAHGFQLGERSEEHTSELHHVEISY